MFVCLGFCVFLFLLVVVVLFCFVCLFLNGRVAQRFFACCRTGEYIPLCFLTCSPERSRSRVPLGSSYTAQGCPKPSCSHGQPAPKGGKPPLLRGAELHRASSGPAAAAHQPPAAFASRPAAAPGAGPAARGWRDAGKHIGPALPGAGTAAGGTESWSCRSSCSWPGGRAGSGLVPKVQPRQPSVAPAAAGRSLAPPRWQPGRAEPACWKRAGKKKRGVILPAELHPKENKLCRKKA